MGNDASSSLEPAARLAYETPHIVDYGPLIAHTRGSTTKNNDQGTLGGKN